jgi:predicted nucleic acid-binding protein
MAVHANASSMIVVDSCVWADYLNGVSHSTTDRLDDALAGDEDISVLPIVITEILRVSGPIRNSKPCEPSSFPFPYSPQD